MTETEFAPRFPEVLAALRERREFLASLCSAICCAAEKDGQRPLTPMELEIFDAVERELRLLTARHERFRSYHRANGKANGNGARPVHNGNGGAL